MEVSHYSLQFVPRNLTKRDTDMHKSKMCEVKLSSFYLSHNEEFVPSVKAILAACELT